MDKFFIITSVFFVLVGCSQPDSDNTTALDTQLDVYVNAKEANDLNTAIAAAYNILALNDSLSTYYDSIANMYFQIGNVKGAYTIANKALQVRSSLLLKEIASNSAKRLGLWSDCVLRYQELMKEDPANMVQYQYNVAECFYGMENYQSAARNMQHVVDNDKSRILDIELISGEEVIKVPYYLAAANFLGYLMILNGDYELAIKAYDDILLKMPDFTLAQVNRQLAIESANKTTPE